MNVERVTCASAIAVGLGVATLTAGAAVADAQGPQPCPPQAGDCQGPGHGGPPDWRGPDYHGGPGGPQWGPPPPDLAWRGIDQGRYDHQPFNYNGSWVEPIYNPDFNGWGFWFLGVWIPL